MGTNAVIFDTESRQALNFGRFGLVDQFAGLWWMLDHRVQLHLLESVAGDVVMAHIGPLVEAEWVRTQAVLDRDPKQADNPWVVGRLQDLTDLADFIAARPDGRFFILPDYLTDCVGGGAQYKVDGTEIWYDNAREDD